MMWGVMVLLVGVYLALRFAIDPILPMSLIKMYMGLMTASVLLYLSSNKPRWDAFKASLVALVIERRLRIPRWMIGIGLPMWLGYGVYAALLPSTEPPSYLRVVHPTPPKEFDVHKKLVRLDDAKNPFRTNDAAMQQHIAEGKTLYYQNCFYCHGDNLDGLGHFAAGFTPRPLNFTDPGTIASITEPVVFWRVSKGGKGLPPESWPWQSAMPAWEEMMTDDEMWKVILYIYSGVGREPKSFGDHPAGGH